MKNQLDSLYEALSETEYRSSHLLAQQLNLSYKTIRMRAKELDKMLHAYGAVIISKPHEGYLIKVVDSESYRYFVDNNLINRLECGFELAEDRLYFLIEYLISSNEYIKMDDLCEMMYISKGTLSNDFKKVQYLFEDFDIQIDRRPNKGVRAIGSEWNRRLCITNLLVFNNRFSFEPPESIEESTLQIGKCIFEVMKSYSFNIPELALQHLVMHIYTAVQRIRQGHSLGYDVKLDPIITQGTVVTQLAELTAKKLEPLYQIKFSQFEINALAVLFAGYFSINEEELLKANFVIPQDDVQIADQMLHDIYDIFKIDLRSNLDLRLSLCKDIVSLKIRLQYNMKAKNPMLDDIKEKYFLAFAMASQSMIAVKAKYNYEISEDEIGFFALLYALALEEKNREIPPKKILLVCASGKSSAQLLVLQLKEEFGEYIDQIIISDLYGVNKIDFNYIDYVFTTIPLKEKIPVPIIEIHPFIGDKELSHVKRTLKMDNNRFLLNYYDPDLFFNNLEANSKEEAITLLCEKIACIRELPENFCQAILKREDLASTDYGDKIAIPHPYKAITRDTFVCVGIFKKSFLWTKNQVQIVFLVSIAHKENANLQEFYQLTANVLLSRCAINELLKHQNFDTLIKLLNNDASEQ